jgi:hypothetical protein
VSTRVELFFDPVCPFCWVTSRWLEEVAEVGAASGEVDLELRYRPISLRILNPDEDAAGAMGRLHARGLELLRVAEAITQRHGDDAVGAFYAAVGGTIHEQPADGDEFADIADQQVERPADLRAVLGDLDLPEDLADAADDDGYDAALRASTEEALARAGDDVGTPIVTFDPPDGPSFFGPILSQVPRGAEAVRLFEATRVLAEHPPFTEFKRSLRALPDTGALAAIR